MSRRKKATEPQETVEELFSDGEKADSGQRARNWILTLKAADTSIEQIHEHLDKYTGWAGQKERGDTTGYEHWQLYVENSQPIRFSALKKAFPTGHFEVVRNKVAAALYVMKTETRIEGPFSHGEIDPVSAQGRRTDLEDLVDQVREGESVSDMIRQDQTGRVLRVSRMLRELEMELQQEKFGSSWRDVEVHYVYGKTGVGKTRSVMDRFGYAAVHSVADYRGHPWDAYRGQEILLLDEFRGQFGMGLMLKLLDGYPMELRARYANRFAGWNRIYVVSNIPFEDQFTDADRPSRAALKRRFTSIVEMKDGGEIVVEYGVAEHSKSDISDIIDIVDITL